MLKRIIANIIYYSGIVSFFVAYMCRKKKDFPVIILIYHRITEDLSKEINMDFFGIGFGEVLLILMLALIIWGPRRLPEIARTLGRTVRALRKATQRLCM